MVTTINNTTNSPRNIFTASRQWAQRPADERFWTVGEMRATCKAYADSAVLAEGIDPSSLRFEPSDDGNEVVGRAESGSTPFLLTHHAFGQVAAAATAPADYMRKLPAYRAADLLTYHFSSPAARQERDLTPRDVLLHRNSRGMIARAMTSERYERIWNFEVCDLLQALADCGWKVPPGRRPYGQNADKIETRRATEADIISFGDNAGGLPVRVGDEIAPSGLYASDHDMFAIMVDPQRTIDDGSAGGLYRAVMLGNSEVGGGSLEATLMWLRSVCGNHILWGVQGVQRWSLRHTGNVRQRWQEAMRWITTNGSKNLLGDEQAIRKLREVKLGGDREQTVESVYRFRISGLSQRDIESAYDITSTTPEDGDPRSAWGIAQGLTRLSQQSVYADKRNKLDEAAGKVLAKIKL